MKKKDNNVTVFIATHKKLNVDLPKGYIPVQVNCANNKEYWENYYYDDYGDNISEKNPFYCELTVLYSLWKNYNSPIKGLCHYRRYIGRDTTVRINERILCDLEHLEDEIIGEKEICHWVYKEHVDVLLAMPYGPYPLNGKQELEKFCYKKDIDILIEVIKCHFPEYSASLENVLSSRNLYYFNMLIAKSEIFDSYCEWLFSVLNKVEEKCDVSVYDVQHKRLYGYLSEVLLNVYFEKINVKKKFFNLVYPYQFINGTKALYEQQKKRERQYELLKRVKLYSFVKNIYKVKNSQLLKKYEHCKAFIRSRS